MKRRASGTEFAQVWGTVLRWSAKDWDDLVELRNRLDVSKRIALKTRAPCGPKGSEDAPTPETESIIKKMRLRRGDGSLASETPEPVKP